MKELAIFGSTGSIGCSTLNVVRRERDRFAVSILTAGHNLQRLAEQIREFTPGMYISWKNMTPKRCGSSSPDWISTGARMGWRRSAG